MMLAATLTKVSTCLAIILFFIQPVYAQRSIEDSLKSMSYIENKFIKLGVDLNLGGAITYLADAKKQENLINNSDWGRQIQMSFYSGPNPFEPLGQKPASYWSYIGWNPIQSGDFAGNRSKVLVHKNTGKSIYIKSIPMHWPLNNFPGECYFESWISLKDNTVEVRSRIVNNRPDKTQYMARHQELPAVYTNAPYHRLITYRGERPFTKDTLSTIANHNFPGAESIQWAGWQATENWAANVNDQNYGLGVYNRHIQSFIGGFYGDESFKGGSKDSPTGYISPVNREVLDHNIVYPYEYTLILGSLEEIRDYVYKENKDRKLPSYKFRNDRQRWVYENTTDQGWPIDHGLVINLKQDAIMASPEIFWKAEEASTLKFKAAYTGNVKKAKVYWSLLGKGFEDARSMDFTVIPDGKIRTYNIPLKNSENYKGVLNGLKVLLDADDSAKTGERVTVKEILLQR